jgi:hypothetical protein
VAHPANGVGWYFNNNYSWGFALQGDAITRTICDVNGTGTAADRLCWHTSAGSILSGYRCGANAGLGSDGAYERIIYDDSPAPVPAPTLSEWAMIMFAMLIVGLGVHQQRRRQS